MIDEMSHGYWCPRAVHSDKMSVSTFTTLILYIVNSLYGINYVERKVVLMCIYVG